METDRSIYLTDSLPLRCMCRPLQMAAPAARRPNPRTRRDLVGDRLFRALAPYISFVDHLRLRLVCTTFRFYCRRLGRPPPPFPWLMLPERAAATARRLFYDIPGGRPYAYDVPGERYYRCVASSACGWLVLSAVDEPRRILLVNPVTGARVLLAWPFGEKRVDRFHAALTSSPADHACFLVVATDRILAYCHPRSGQGWFTLRAPGFRYDAASSDMITVRAMVYLVDDRRKVWRADLGDSEPKVERRNTAVPLPLADRTNMLHYLVESLWLVHLVLSDEHHRQVEVFRLDWDKRMWVPDNVRGDRVLLLGRGCSAVVPAAGRLPGTVLFAHQPSLSLSDVGGTSSDGGGLAWFWAESREGADDLLVLKKTLPHRQGEFTAGDSLWFFPAIDPDETAVIPPRPGRS